MSNNSQGAISAVFNKAVESSQAGDLRTAALLLQRLTLLAPTDVGVWRALARCHDQFGESEVAEHLRWLGQSLAEGAQ